MANIQNLPGYEWIYPGKPNRFGITVTARRAINVSNPADQLTPRQAQERAAGGVRLETLRPPEQRKRYFRHDTLYELQARQFQQEEALAGRKRSLSSVRKSRAFHFYLLREKNRLDSIVTDFRVAQEAAGVSLSDREARESPELITILDDLSDPDNGPNGRKARALLALGRREAWWDWDVGESPPVGEAA